MVIHTKYYTVCLNDSTAHGEQVELRSDADAYLVLACDGLWDAVSDAEAAAIVDGVVGVGLGRNIAVHYRSFTLYLIR